MAKSRPHLLVVWSGADASGVRALLSGGKLPVAASRLASGATFSPLSVPAAPDFALSLGLALGASPADHRWLGPVQPAADLSGWLPLRHSRLPSPPFWERLAATGRSFAAIGWPGTHDDFRAPRRVIVPDLELIATDPSLRPLPPLREPHPLTFRIAASELDPAILGFFIPRAELPSDPSTDPVIRALLWNLGHLYSAHNTAVAHLQSDQPPDLLAVHYRLPRFPAFALRRHSRLNEASVRLLDLLLGDLLRHAPEAGLTLVGFSPGGGFSLSAPNLPPSATKLADIAPLILSTFDVSPNQTVPSRSEAPEAVDDAALLLRNRELGIASGQALEAPPSPAILHRHEAALGRVFLTESRPAEALPLLAAAHFRNPEAPRAALPLYECLHSLGLRDEASEVAQTLREHSDPSSRSRLIEAGLLLHHRRDAAQAMPLLEALLQDPRLAARAAPLHREALLHLRRFAEARPLLESAIAEGDATADTHAGLAYACFHLGEHTAAEASARSALELGSLRPQPALILQHLSARRAGRSPEPDLPAWDVLIADLARRNELATAYAKQRAEFIATRAARRASISPLLFVTGTPPLPADATWTIVTGAPRSGMALLLRMLAFGGHPVLTDGIRAPDADNPCGYFEWQPVQGLPSRPTLVDEAANHALKLPLALLDYLPRDRRYRVLFVTRDIDEIARSQAALLNLPPPSTEAVASLANHLNRRLEAIRADPAFDLLEVPYRELREQAAAWAERLADFLGPERLRRLSAMPAAVRADLPRHRRA